MKINVFLTTLSLLFALLVGYFAYTIAQGKDNDLLYGAGTAISFAATIIPAIAMQFGSARLGTNIKVFASLSCFLSVIVNLSLAGFGVTLHCYIITDGILLILYLVLLYNMMKVTSV